MTDRGGLSKKQLRQEKRELKKIGNQQRRSRERAALRDLVRGDADSIPEFRHDRPTADLNGADEGGFGGAR